MTQPHESTPTASSRVIVDGIAFQEALRAAMAVAPSSPKKECSVVGVHLPLDEGRPASVYARNPDLGITLTVKIPTIDLDVVDEMSEFIEITLPEARRLLSHKVTLPKEDEPWPELSWDVTDTRISQTDAHVLLGRRTDIQRLDRAQHVLGDVPSALIILRDREDRDVRPTTSSAQLKTIAAAFSHLGEGPMVIALQRGPGQLDSSLWQTVSATLHAVTPDPNAGPPDDQDTSGLQAAAQKLRETLKANGTTLTIVGATPPGGFA